MKINSSKAVIANQKMNEVIRVLGEWRNKN